MTIEHQKITRERIITGADGRPEVMIVTIRHDDECHNGHNSFAIAGEVYTRTARHGEAKVTRDGKLFWLDSCGCLHEVIAKHFPDLAPLLRWHLFSANGPMHYLANALYWAGHAGWCKGGLNDPPNVDHLRSTIAFGAVPDHDRGAHPERMNKKRLTEWLTARLPDLIQAFRDDVEKLGMKF